jgi:hypothetical protein
MRTTYSDFATNYISKTGEKITQTVLGRPNLQLKLESDLNYEYIQALLGNINAWNSSTTYSAGQIVKYNNKVYISQQDNNLNQEPYTANSTYWTYNSFLTYGNGSNVFNLDNSTVVSNYTIPSGKSATTIGNGRGIVTINAGVTVTVSAISRWIII